MIACMFGSSKLWGPNSTHYFGTYMPGEEPSTASEAASSTMPATVKTTVAMSHSDTASYPHAVDQFFSYVRIGLLLIKDASHFSLRENHRP